MIVVTYQLVEGSPEHVTLCASCAEAPPHPLGAIVEDEHAGPCDVCEDDCDEDPMPRGDAGTDCEDAP